MLKVAVIEDDVEHLVRVIRNFVALQQRREDFEIVPILLSDPAQDTLETINSWSEEEKEPLRQAGVDVSNWPAVRHGGHLCPVDEMHRAQILALLDAEGVDAIISDSWLGREDPELESRFSDADLKLAGIRLLDAAEQNGRWQGKCWLMTKFGNDVTKELFSVSGWRPERFNPFNFKDYRYIDKNAVSDVVPGECETQLERVIIEGSARMRLNIPVELPPEVRSEGRFGRLFGASAPMCDVYRTIVQVAESDATVLILGETGTGKELIAAEIYERSRRSDKQMISLNCANLPKELITSELFGHEPGAFTGANKRKIGLFEAAGGGTLFLDEIGELPPDAQANLLRALQERRIRRVGAVTEIDVDVRLVAATNKKLTELVETGEFREDLYARLAVIEITAPPLRDRAEDISCLTSSFIHKLNQKYGPIGKNVTDCSDGFISVLKTQDWPRNVRQLENLIEEAFVRLPKGCHALDENNQALKKLTNTADESSQPKKLSAPSIEVHAQSHMEVGSSLGSYHDRSAGQVLDAIKCKAIRAPLALLKLELGVPKTLQIVGLFEADPIFITAKGAHAKDAVTMEFFSMHYNAWRRWKFAHKEKARDVGSS